MSTRAGVMTGKGGVAEITVIVAAYNAGSTLEEQLSALAGQDVSFPWELLICDNGSTDDTRAIATTWMQRLPELSVIDASRRRGASAARNIGAEHASAPIILFCDADDVVGSGWLARMHSALQTSTAVAGAAEVTLLNSSGSSSVSWPPGDVITEPFWPQYPAAASRNLGVQRSFFNHIGGFDEQLMAGEDIDFCWRVQAAGGDLTWCMDALVHMRKRVGLREVFRQAYGYARGDKLLQHKWSAAIAQYWLEQGDAIDDMPQARVTHRGPGARASRLRRISRLARPDGRADLAWVLGSWCGSRFSRVETSIPRIDALR